MLAVVGCLVLFTDGLALRGLFKGDRFVAGAVGLLVASILVFTAWPVRHDAEPDVHAARRPGRRRRRMADRLFDRKIWGLACVAGPRELRRVLEHAGAGDLARPRAATMLGLCFALIVTRTAIPGQRALRLLTVLPIITPPFVIGLGLILIFGRSGVVNQIGGGGVRRAARPLDLRLRRRAGWRRSSPSRRPPSWC